MPKHPQSTDTQVLDRIAGHGAGWVFTPADFLDLGTRTAVGLALMRHARAGTIRQLARGVYDYPVKHAKFGVIPPDTYNVALALKGRDDFRLQPTGASAANVLGLSTQVPVRSVYLTDGRPRRVTIGRQEIILKRASTRQMATAGRVSGTVIQALRWIGKRGVDDRTVAILKRRLSDKDKQQLLKDLRYAPGWIAEVMREVSAPART